MNRDEAAKLLRETKKLTIQSEGEYNIRDVMEMMEIDSEKIAASHMKLLCEQGKAVWVGKKITLPSGRHGNVWRFL